MKPMLALSTRELMRLVALAAANLVLFKEVWFVLILPPATLVAVVLNLGFFCAFVRPRSMNDSIHAAMATGLIVAIAALTYLPFSLYQPCMAAALLDVLPCSVYGALPASVSSASGARLLDFALVDLAGLAVMLLLGWLAWPRGKGRGGTGARSRIRGKA